MSNTTPHEYVDDGGMVCGASRCGQPVEDTVHPPAGVAKPDEPAPTTLGPNTPLKAVVAWLRSNVDEGVTCPACTQRAKVYRRKINSGMARSIIAMYRHTGGTTEWFYLPAISDQWQGRDEAGLRYWGLIEEATEPRPDGGRAGWWRLTQDGVKYVRGEVSPPTYARVYDGRVLGHVGDRVGIRVALGAKFNYDDLMAGV